MTEIKVRAVGVLIKDDKVLLIHRMQDGKEFWVLPGGGKEENETVKEAVVREIEEEASIQCEIVELLYKHKYSDIGHKHYYYLCKYISGKPKLGDFNEMKTMEEEDQKYNPKWVSINKLPRLLLYPLEIRDWIIKDYQGNFKDTPKIKTLGAKDLRQEI